jgi:hypothetical protein
MHDIIQYIDNSGWISLDKIENKDDIKKFIDSFEKKKQILEDNIANTKFEIFKYILDELESKSNQLQFDHITNMKSNYNKQKKNTISNIYKKLQDSTTLNDIINKCLNIKYDIDGIKKNNYIGGNNIFNNPFQSISLSESPLLISIYQKYITNYENINKNQNISNEIKKFNNDIKKFETDMKTNLRGNTYLAKNINNLVIEITKYSKTILNKKISYSLNNLVCSNRIDLNIIGIPLKIIQQLFINEMNGYIEKKFDNNNLELDNISFFYTNYECNNNRNLKFKIDNEYNIFEIDNYDILNVVDHNNIENDKILKLVNIQQQELTSKKIYILQLLNNKYQENDKKIEYDNGKFSISFSFIIKYCLYSFIYTIIVNILNDIFSDCDNAKDIHNKYLSYYQTKLCNYFININEINKLNIKKQYFFEKDKNNIYIIDEIQNNLTKDKYDLIKDLFKSQYINIIKYNEYHSKYELDIDNINKLFNDIFINNIEIDLYEPYKKQQYISLGGPLQDKSKNISIKIYNEYLKQKYNKNNIIKKQIDEIIINCKKKANYSYIKILYDNLEIIIRNPNNINYKAIEKLYTNIKKKVININILLYNIKEKSKKGNISINTIKNNNILIDYYSLLISQNKIEADYFRLLLHLFINDNKIIEKIINKLDVIDVDINKQFKMKLSEKSNYNKSKNKLNNNLINVLNVNNNNNNNKFKNIISELNNDDFKLIKKMKIYFKNNIIYLPFYYKKNNIYKYGLFNISSYIIDGFNLKKKHVIKEDNMTKNFIKLLITNKNNKILVTKLNKNIKEYSKWRSINYKQIIKLKKKSKFEQFKFIKSLLFLNYQKILKSLWPKKGSKSLLLNKLIKNSDNSIYITMNNIIKNIQK